jgi:hypothetical protein
MAFTAEQEARYARVAAAQAKITAGNGTTASNAPSTAQIAASRPSATYVTNDKGQTTSQYNQNGATYNVLKDSWADPLSSNYSAILNDPNRPAGLTLADLDSSSPTGISLAFNGTPGSGASNSVGYLDRIAAKKGMSVNDLIKQMGSFANNQTLANGQIVGGGNNSAAYSGSGTAYGSSSLYLSGGLQQDSTSYINQLKQAQIANNTAALDKAKNSALSNLSSEKALIQPAAMADRNKANIGMNNANKSWNEFLAAKGLNSSGSASLGTVLNQAAYLGNVGSINRDATAKEADIAKRTTDIKNNYATDLAAAQSGAEATALQNYLNQYNMDRTFNYNASRDAVSDNRYTDETTYNRNQDTLNRTDAQTQQQKEDYLNTISRFSKDYTAEINNVRGDGDNTNDWQIPYLETARAQKIADIAAQQATLETKAAAAKTEAEQQAFDNALDLWKVSKVADKNIASILKIPVGTKTADYNLATIKAATSRTRANTSSSRSNSSSSSTATTKTQNNTYQEALTQYNNMDAGAALKNLKEYADSYINQLGSSNYNKLVAIAQERLYQTMLADYNDFTASAAYSSVLNNRDHIVGQIGSENYNKLLAAEKKRYESFSK